MTRMSRTRRLSPAGSSEAAWSEPHMARSRVMCRSTKQAPSADRGERGLQPALVPGVPDRHVGELRLQGVDHAQVQLLVAPPGRCDVAWHSTRLSRAEDLDRVPDLLQASTCRSTGSPCLPGGAHGAQQLVVGQARPRRPCARARRTLRGSRRLGTSHGEANQCDALARGSSRRSPRTRPRRTRRGGGSRCRSSGPTASRARCPTGRAACRSRACASGT